MVYKFFFLMFFKKIKFNKPIQTRNWVELKILKFGYKKPAKMGTP